MRIQPTMSHAVDKNHLNELLVKYYQDLVSEYDQNLGTVRLLLSKAEYSKAIVECDMFLESLDCY